MQKAIATERKGSFFGMVMNDNEFEQRKRKFKPRKNINHEHLHDLALILLQFLKKLLLERYFITERLRWCY